MKQWRKQKIIDNLWGPIGTILVHVLAVVLLFTLVKFKARTVERDVEVVIREIEEVEEIEEIEQELEQLEDIPTVVDAIAPPTVATEQPPAVDAMQAPGSDGIDMSEFSVVEAVSPLRFKGLYASRSSGGRSDALGRYGGGLGKRTEAAVMRAFRWLNTHQYPDGSWGPSYRASMTGLALLSFFAHGETTASPEFGDAIRKGLQYLLARQTAEGIISTGGPVSYYSPAKFANQVSVYEHAIATYALAEAYNLTRIPYLRKPMEKALQAILDGQHEAGSWDYGYAKGPEAQMDVSLSGWCIQALKAGAAAGAENPGLKAAIESSVHGLKLQFREYNDMFQYSTRDRNHDSDAVMTAVAVLCMQLTGHALDDDARKGMTTLARLQFQWAPSEAGRDDKRAMRKWPYYGWYYLTQARFHQGGRSWATWNKKCAPILCDMQNDDGSWCPAPASSEGMYGPVYFTTLAALQLQVYYRFLPSYKPIEIEDDPDLEDLDDLDEIQITLG